MEALLHASLYAPSRPSRPERPLDTETLKRYRRLLLAIALRGAGLVSAEGS